MTSGIGDGRGVLFPEALPSFERREPPARLRALVRWFWITRWSLPDGRTSRQVVLPFPASNLVAEPHGIALHGPATGSSVRELHGTGWAFGALLRPKGLGRLDIDPAGLVDGESPVAADGCHAEMSAAMERGDVDAAEKVLVAWLAAPGYVPTETERLADRLVELVSEDREIVGVEGLAERMALSTRAVQRLTRRHIGIPPLAVIRRYRLQEAAVRIRDDPALRLSDVAAALGYSDQSHLAADFRRTLGLTAGEYRRSGGTPSPGTGVQRSG